MADQPDRWFQLPPIIYGPSFAREAAPASWAVAALAVEEARKIADGSGVAVAVLDTGVDPSHPEFSGRIDAAESFVPGETYHDQHGHGTHCLGTVGGNSPTVGMSQGCRLLVGKVLDANGSGADTWIAAGIDWAVKKGALVVSMSLGSSAPAPRIEDAIRRAVDAGVLVVCAAGNSGQAGIDWPGKSPNAFNVGAFDRNFKVASFSSRGEKLDTMGPGVGIVSAAPGGGYQEMSGTSMATPAVSGMLSLYFSALLKGGRAVPTVSELRKLAADRSVDAGAPGDDPDYGPGWLSPAMLSLAVPGKPPRPE